MKGRIGATLRTSTSIEIGMMYFADMARWLAPAKVEFACSAHYLDQLDAINLTADQQALFCDIPDPQ